MCKNWTSRLLSVGALLSIVLAAATLSLAGKPGGGGGKPKPPPPVLYELTWLGTLGGEESEALDINNEGEVVGWAHASDGRSRAFVYTTETGIMADLNDVAPLPGGWVARNARGINELGQIAGNATKDGEGGRAFFYDPTVQPPQSMLLPTIGPGNHSGRSINDCGDIVASYNDPELGAHTVVYKWDDDNLEWYFSDIWQRPGYPVKINNQRQILHHCYQSAGGVCARYTPAPGPGWETFDFVEDVRGMNEDGTFVGRTHVKNGELYPAPVKRSNYAGYRFTDPDQIDIVLEGSVAYAADVNINGDVCGGIHNRPFVYTDRDGLLEVEDLLIGDESDVSVWMGREMKIKSSRGINDRDAATGFGQICGRALSYTDDKYVAWAFLLTPVGP